MSRGFRVADGLDRLRARLTDAGLDASATPDGLVEAAVDFYRGERARKVDLDADGDLLLVQWQRPTRGPHAGLFEFELVRQLSPRRSHELTQIALTLRFHGEGVPTETPNGNRWFAAPTVGLLEEIRALPGFLAVNDVPLVGFETRADRF